MLAQKDHWLEMRRGGSIWIREAEEFDPDDPDAHLTVVSEKHHEDEILKAIRLYLLAGVLFAALAFVLGIVIGAVI